MYKNVFSFSRNEMSRHMDSHQQKCNDCDFKCMSGKSLEVHRKAEHMFKCKKCKATLATKEALGTHTTVAHMFKCQKCGVLFEHKSLLEKHFRASHMVKCSMCPQVKHLFSFAILNEILPRSWIAPLPWRVMKLPNTNPAR